MAGKIHSRIGIVGLGIMGSPMARNLLRAGWQVKGCDLDEASLNKLVANGGTSCSTPTQVSEDADVVLVMVQNTVAIDEVLFGEHGVVHSLGQGGVIWLGS